MYICLYSDYLYISQYISIYSSYVDTVCMYISGILYVNFICSPFCIKDCVYVYMPSSRFAGDSFGETKRDLRWSHPGLIIRTAVSIFRLSGGHTSSDRDW